MKSKLFFNSLAFILAGLLSVIRHEEFALIISVGFAVIFFVLSLIFKKEREAVMAGQYD